MRRSAFFPKEGQQKTDSRNAVGFAFYFAGKCAAYSCGPAATRALPASLVVYLTKFFWKREARSLAFSSQAGGYFAKMAAGGEQLLSPKIKRRYDCEINRRRLEKLRAFCEKNNVSPAALCVAYITNNRLEGAAIIGSSKVAQMEESIQGVDVDLDFDTCDSFIK